MNFFTLEMMHVSHGSKVDCYRRRHTMPFARKNDRHPAILSDRFSLFFYRVIFDWAAGIRCIEYMVSSPSQIMIPESDTRRVSSLDLSATNED